MGDVLTNWMGVNEDHRVETQLMLCSRIIPDENKSNIYLKATLYMHHLAESSGANQTMRVEISALNGSGTVLVASWLGAGSEPYCPQDADCRLNRDPERRDHSL
jgi:hypothetical protein